MPETRNVPTVTPRIPRQRTYADRVPSTDRGRALAEYLRAARKAKGWTQDQLIEASGVSRSTLLRYEGGDASRPDNNHVRALCLALDRDPLEAAVILGYITDEDLNRGNLHAQPSRRISEIEALGLSEAQEAEVLRYAKYLVQTQHEG